MKMNLKKMRESVLPCNKSFKECSLYLSIIKHYYREVIVYTKNKQKTLPLPL